MIRRLGPDDAALLRQVRLTALADAPEAFGSTLERELAFPDQEWQRRVAPGSHPTFVWETAGTARGLVVVLREPVVQLVSMWVAPVARGGPAAGSLVEAAVAWADAAGAGTVRLHVAEGNDRAQRLYTRHGFSPTGVVERRERDGHPELEMERRLR